MRWVVLIACIAGACVEAEERPATWEYIHPTIIVPNCATSNCHSNLGAAPIGTSVAGLPLDGAENSFILVTGQPCDGGNPEELPGGNVVVPFQPDASKLMYQLRGEEVRRMPPDIPLAPAEISLIERWIMEGAPCR